MKTAEIHLPYYKQGDDLRYHLDNSESFEAALKAHAEQLEAAAAVLREVRERVDGEDITLNADTHWIGIEGPDDLIDSLIASGLAHHDPFEDEYEDDECDESEEDPEDEPESAELD